MQALKTLNIVGAGALAAVSAVALAACGPTSSKGSGPMAELTDDVFGRLHPEAFRGARQLQLDTESVRAERRENGSLQGTYDGTRLLAAADDHEFGAPRIVDPELDVKGDGAASWNEVREVLRHFDVDGSGGYGASETTAYQADVGLRWIPGTSS